MNPVGGVGEAVLARRYRGTHQKPTWLPVGLPCSDDHETGMSLDKISQIHDVERSNLCTEAERAALRLALLPPSS